MSMNEINLARALSANRRETIRNYFFLTLGATIMTSSNPRFYGP